MAPSLTTQHSLPRGNLKRLLEKNNLLKADLSKKSKVGENTLNKRTVTKIDAGEPVKPSTLETLRKALRLESIDELFLKEDTANLRELDLSDTFHRYGWRKGEPVIVRAEEATWEALFHRRFGSVEFETILDSVTDEQFDLLQRLEFIILNRKLTTEDSAEEKKIQGIREGGQLTQQLNKLKRQDSYESLLKELRQQNIAIHIVNFSFNAMRIEEVEEEEYNPYSGETTFHHRFKRIYDSFYRTLIIVSNTNVQFDVKIPGSVAVPSSEEIRENPDKFFTIAEPEISEFDINPASRVEIVKNGCIEAYYRDGKLHVDEDAIPF